MIILAKIIGYGDNAMCIHFGNFTSNKSEVLVMHEIGLPQREKEKLGGSELLSLNAEESEICHKKRFKTIQKRSYDKKR